MIRRALIGCLGALAAAALVFPAAAPAALAQEEQQGHGLAEAVRSGEKQCSQLSADDFELIGEYAMGRYLADPAAHEAMNRHMTAMMGAEGERRMHTALGYRYSECEGGPASRWVGPMAGMMYGGYGHGESGGSYGPGMMGGNWNEESGEHAGSEYRRSMMGDGWPHDGDIGVWGVVLIAFGAALLGGGLVALTMHLRGPRQHSAP
ncbi:MAG TPA: hypothetical protein VND98_05560 [Solirubrobacterales bacterium]|nr:hypothetical protein [Solirubrobacterales bacterium]